jgi:pyruvate kinase
MKRNRKAEVVATLGPASSTPNAVRALFDTGADVFRLNFSHGASGTTDLLKLPVA